MKIYSELYYYDKTGNLIRLKECDICKEFLFDRQNFVLLSSGKRYYICIEHDIDKSKKGALLSFWGHDKEDLSSSEVISLFRSEYRKNKINSDLIELFLTNPLKCKKKYGKKKIS